MPDHKMNIRKIDSTSILKICSDQVVVNLASVVKELLENSFDSGATALGIKYRV